MYNAIKLKIGHLLDLKTANIKLLQVTNQIRREEETMELFSATKKLKEGAIDNITLAFQKKVQNLKKQKIVYYEKKKNEFKNDPTVDNVNNTLRANGITKSFTEADLLREISKKTDYEYIKGVRSATFSAYRLGNKERRFPAPDTFSQFSQFCEKTTVELMFNNPDRVLEYEKELLFEILDHAISNIGKHVPPSYVGPYPVFMVFLSQDELAKDNEKINLILQKIWSLRSDVEKMRIQQIEEHPEALELSKRKDMYVRSLVLIKMLFKYLTTFDNSKNYHTDGNRLGRYNDLKDVTFKNIQEVGLSNVLIYVQAVDYVFHQLQNISFIDVEDSKKLEIIIPKGIEKAMKAWDRDRKSR